MNNARSVYTVILLMLGVCLIILPGDASAFQEKFQKLYDIGGGLAVNHYFDARETYDGGLITAYVKQGGGSLNWLYVVKTDSCGTPQFQMAYELSTNPGECFSVAPVIIRELAGVGYIIAGTIINNSSQCSSIYLMKIDLAGTLLWINRFGTGYT